MCFICQRANKQASIPRKERLNGRRRPQTNPADSRRDLSDDGCKDGCACVEGVHGLKSWAADDAAKFHDPAVEAFDQVAPSINGPLQGISSAQFDFDGMQAR
jgi:hypothetical protein